MKIAIQPTPVFVPNKGMKTATHVEVTVLQHELGVKARGSYALQAQLQIPSPPGPKAPGFETLGTGQADLTPAQFAAWGIDDTAFALAIVANAGLTPA